MVGSQKRQSKYPFAAFALGGVISFAAGAGALYVAQEVDNRIFDRDAPTTDITGSVKEYCRNVMDPNIEGNILVVNTKDDNWGIILRQDQIIVEGQRGIQEWDLAGDNPKQITLPELNEVDLTLSIEHTNDGRTTIRPVNCERSR